MQTTHVDQAPDVRPSRGTHRGRISARPAKSGRIMVLCPVGHLVASMGAREWAGSLWESRVGAGFEVTCEGAMPDDVVIPHVTPESWDALRKRGIVHVDSAEEVAAYVQAQGERTDPRAVRWGRGDAVRLRVARCSRTGEPPFDVWILAKPGSHDLTSAAFQTTCATETGGWFVLNTWTARA
ncbi:hypothetical protein [Saccharothrix hoggarensis]|uniref:Uncharacterized protein n=1 Tax=Saccharothrix hoggarensis TaxID=913853 RepID=A0ABW3QGP9_9PSEU